MNLGLVRFRPFFQSMYVRHEVHRLIKFAVTKGKGHQMLERLYRAYLSEQKSVFERGSLTALAAELGLDPNDAQAAFESEAFLAQVEADQAGMRAFGGNGVPFVLIGGKVGCPRRRTPKVFAHALSQGWAELPKQPVEIGNGTVCGPQRLHYSLTHESRTTGAGSEPQSFASPDAQDT